MKEQQIHRHQGSRKIFELIFRPFDELFNPGKHMLRADGRMQQCKLVIHAWMADYIEDIHLQSIK